MLWLLEQHPDQYDLVCSAEDAVSALEQQGRTDEEAYESACAELLRRFKTVLRLKVHFEIETWFR